MQITVLPPWDMISRVAEALYTASLVVIAERKLVAVSRDTLALLLGELVIARDFGHLDNALHCLF